MKVLVFPRDPNPYQDLLYGEMQRLGVQVHYLGALTASHTVNLLLLPLETAARRVGGARLVHLHWVFSFSFPGAQRFPLLRRLAQLWFTAWLGTCRMIGLRLVWTAHNVLPHEPVFADDVAARRVLVRACDLVLAHSEPVLAAVAALGAVARRTAVIPHGPISYGAVAAPPSSGPARRGAGDPRRFVFFGQVQEYKGVEELLTAFLDLPGDAAAELTVAGQCRDPALRSRLLALAERGGRRIELRLEYVPDGEVAQLLDRADVVVLPFRRVTTSGSAILALCHGRPLLVPDLPALADLPREAVTRYGDGVAGLTAALARFIDADRETLDAMSAAARRFAATLTWADIARQTTAAMRCLLPDAAGSDQGHLARAH